MLYSWLEAGRDGLSVSYYFDEFPPLPPQRCAENSRVKRGRQIEWHPTFRSYFAY